MKLRILAALAALSIPGVAAAADVSGAWKVSTNANGQALTINCSLAQAAAALSGTCGLADGSETPAQLTGTVDGDKAAWAYDVDFQGQKLHVSFAGMVDSPTAMSGEMEVFGSKSPFTAVKQ